MPSASARRDGRQVSAYVAILLTLWGFRARAGIDVKSPKRLLASAARVGRHHGLARVFGQVDPRALVAAIAAAIDTRVAYFEKELIWRARPIAACLRTATATAARARETVAALRRRRAELADVLAERQVEVDDLVAKQPDPPPPPAPTEDELRDEQDDGEPVYRQTAAAKLPQRVVEATLDLVTFYPLLASAALGSALLGVDGSRLLVLAMALAASIGLPLAACRLGAMTVEGALRDHRRSMIAWLGWAVLMTVPPVVGVARALHVLDGEYGNLAAGLGVFGVSQLMIGVIVLEFVQGRRAAHGALVEGRRAVAAEQRRRRFNPPPPPEPQELVAARQRLAEAREALADCNRELARETSQLEAAELQIEEARVELREIRAEGLRMAREEVELGRLAATEALRLSDVNLRRYGPPGASEPDLQDLVDELETSFVFDPFDLVTASAMEGSET